MKKFETYSIYFFLPLFLSALTLEYIIRQIPNPYKYKFEWMQDHAGEVETLIFGSSHTFYGVRPEFIAGNSFNLAEASQGLKQDLYLLNYWSGRYEKLKTVIFPMSYATWFGRGLEHGVESYRCRYYKLYMDCNLYSDLSKDNFELSDMRSARGKLMNYALGGANSVGCDKYGWGKALKLKNKEMEKWMNETEAVASVRRHTIHDKESVPINISMMRKVADICKKHHAKLVLVTTPCWSAYYERLDTTQLSTMYKLTNRFVEENGAIYLDYLKDRRFIAEDFYDSNHLSDKGAEKFTKILNNDINYNN